MSLKQYLLIMTFGTLLCWLAWVFVILKVSPYDGGLIGLISFYLSLFLAIIGTFSVFGFMIRSIILKDDEAVFRHVKHTFRQSIFVALVIVMMLVMLSRGWLYWWNAIILIMFFVFIEAYFFSTNKNIQVSTLTSR